MSKPGSISALEQAVRKAMALHQSGNLPAAQAAYEAVLRQFPKEPNTLMNLSTLHLSTGNFDEAGRLLKRLIAAHPKLPQPHFNYGNLLMQQGRLLAAVASFDRAIALTPHADIYYNRGIVLDKLRRFEDALASFDTALKLDPAHARAFCNRIATLNYLGRPAEALAATDHPFARGAQDQAWLYLTRGIALQELKRFDEALADYAQALALDPNRHETYSHRANALNHLHRYPDALVDAEQAFTLGAASGFAHNVRAVARNRTGHYAEAMADYEQALTLDPSLESVNWNLAVVKLTLGDYVDGLPLYEWRWKVGPQKGAARDLPMPLWLGHTSLEGKSILVHPEQGLGDFIQSARYLSLLVARGAQVVVETPPALTALFKENVAGEHVQVFAAGEALPAADFHCPIMSLPLALGITVNTIPAEMPYFRANAEKTAEWQGYLGIRTKPRIGLVWSGRAQHVYDNKRSIPLEMLHRLLQQHYEFHSLQKEVRDTDLESLPKLQSHADALHDFSDTAALISQMDLVVTVDTSVAHLAGMMGKPVWILLPHVPDYRWLLERTDSPLYPSARLFRLGETENWDAAVARVIAALPEVL